MKTPFTQTLIALSGLFYISAANAGSCNLSPDYQNLSTYQGDLGVSQDFVASHKGAVGQIRKNGFPWCTGTLIEGDRFLTAGHCFTSTNDQAEYTVVFDYQTDLDSLTFPVNAILESQSHPFDYAILQLDGSPSDIYPIARLKALDINNEAANSQRQTTVIQHPLGKVKQIDSDLAETIGTGYWKSNVDIDGGASGSGVLDHNGYLMAVVSGSGCGIEDNWISTGSTITQISQHSNLVSDLLDQSQQEDEFGYINDFENGINWANSGNLNWRISGNTNELEFDSLDLNNTGKFAYLKKNENVFNNNEQAILVSHPITLSHQTFSFDLNIYNQNSANLTVDLLSQGDWLPVWSASAQQQVNDLESSSTVSIDISAYQGQTIKLRLRAGSLSSEIMTLDNLSIDSREITQPAEIEKTVQRLNVSHAAITQQTQGNSCDSINVYPNWARVDIEGEAATHHDQGDAMVYGDKAYLAKWYTNSVPGSDHSWTLLHSCSDLQFNDTDKDGVVDNIDDCPNTIEGLLVDQQGCDLPAKQNSCQDIKQYPDWNHADWDGGEETHHLGGEMMVYQGHIYEAKWYASSIPGSDERWTYIGACE